MALAYISISVAWYSGYRVYSLMHNTLSITIKVLEQQSATCHQNSCETGMYNIRARSPKTTV